MFIRQQDPPDASRRIRADSSFPDCRLTTSHPLISHNNAYEQVLCCLGKRAAYCTSCQWLTQRVQASIHQRLTRCDACPQDSFCSSCNLLCHLSGALLLALCCNLCCWPLASAPVASATSLATASATGQAPCRWHRRHGRHGRPWGSCLGSCWHQEVLQEAGWGIAAQSSGESVPQEDIACQSQSKSDA